ncbi:MAG TPA: glycoside hydrolase family 9 protein, partial [Fibrobacteraceae bacterium]|nr:glycoside hydrolase family 9 protein [Fibrobacteraceae bacterium]
MSRFHSWFRFLSIAGLLLGLDAWSLDFSIDKTCKTCTRRYMDSINVYDRRPIRVNQVGFRPQDTKKAFVSDPSSTTFKVINAETGVDEWSGTLEKLGTYTKPKMWVNGAFNSLTSIYEFPDSDSSSTSSETETLYQAEFSSLATAGLHAIIVGQDTSAIFRIDSSVYNAVFETGLMFFGSNRCGNTDSWMHAACHLKDGSAVDHDLSGGWHDCGDHGKYGETEGYAAYMINLTYALWPEKAEDNFGSSYYDTLPFGNDGIPDLLWEAKIGADYIFKLYKASKADGLIGQNDMYHSVGMGPGMDHLFWDVPEHQDAQPQGKGGPDRPVTAGIGVNVAGMYTAALAYFAYGWELFDQTYADSIKAAAIEMYDSLVIPNLGKETTEPCCYDGGGQLFDDPVAAAVALFYLTKDQKYYKDLFENDFYGDNSTNAMYNDGYFPSGLMGWKSGFYHGGWTTDFQQVHAPTTFALAKLILGTRSKAAAYGIDSTVRDSLLEDCVAALRRSVQDGSGGSNGDTTIIASSAEYATFKADQPYHGVFTSSTWGLNRYNMGLVTELFMLWELTGEQAYFDIGLDNMDYNLGRNPWDLSFVMGTGEKNLQHPHNRAANPDGYNAGGIPYDYTSPKGALMGGCKPTATLKDDWSDYTVTETCIDFSSQLLIPAQILAKDLPEDTTGPEFSNVAATPISDTSAIISWSTDELAAVTVYVATSANGTPFDTLFASLTKNGSVEVDGLVEGETYYFYLVGMDVRKNTTTDDNHGDWYSFTMTTSN